MQGACLSWLLVLPVFVLVPAVPAERGAALKCYQCKGDSRDSLPLCDTSFWKLTTAEERRSFLFQCPTRKSAFCVKKVNEADTYRTTFRGCVGNMDESKTPLRKGCRTERGSGSVMCLCPTDACNGSRRAALAGRAAFATAAAVVLLLLASHS